MLIILDFITACKALLYEANVTSIWDVSSTILSLHVGRFCPMPVWWIHLFICLMTKKWNAVSSKFHLLNIFCCINLVDHWIINTVSTYVSNQCSLSVNSQQMAECALVVSSCHKWLQGLNHCQESLQFVWLFQIYVHSHSPVSSDTVCDCQFDSGMMLPFAPHQIGTLESNVLDSSTRLYGHDIFKYHTWLYEWTPTAHSPKCDANVSWWSYILLTCVFTEPTSHHPTTTI